MRSLVNLACGIGMTAQTGCCDLGPRLEGALQRLILCMTGSVRRPGWRIRQRYGRQQGTNAQDNE